MPRGMTEALLEALEGAPSVQANLQRANADGQEQEQEQKQDAVGNDEENAEVGGGGAEDPNLSESVDEGVDLEYVNDIPDLLGITPEEFHNLKWRLGDNEAVPVGTVKDRLQQVESEREQLAQQRAQIEEQQKQIRQQALQYGQSNQAVTQKMQEAYGRLVSIQQAYPALQQDWATREKDDPGQVALERQRIQEQANIAQVQYQQAQFEAQQEQQKAYADWLSERDRTLARDLGTEWTDLGKRRQLEDRITRLAIDRYGATAEEARAFDPRMYKLLLDAELGIKAGEGAKAAVEKVRTAPKVSPKGVRVKNLQHSKKRMQDLENRAQKTRARKDVIAATRAIFEDALSNK